MSSDGTRGGGALGPLFSIQRAVVEGGVGLQRAVADRLLDRIEDVEDRTRRARLSSHYTAVQTVDRIEDAHPDEDASLDPLYDGVGRTFDVAESLDSRTHEFTTRTVENGVSLSESVSAAYLGATERRCGVRPRSSTVAGDGGDSDGSGGGDSDGSGGSGEGGDA